MSLITLKDLSLTRSTTLFSDLDLALAKGDRLGLVAANGRGKSSLLRILAGQDQPTSGELARARGLAVAIAPQDPPEALLGQSLRSAVLDGLDHETAEAESWRADILLDDLLVPPQLREQVVRDLSGGWQRVMLLARAAISEPDLLLLDEPTNHLDLARIGILQRFLEGLPRGTAMIAASHDRAFLDAVTSRTLFLRPSGSADFALPYSRARAALAEADAAQDRQFENDMRKVKALRQQAAKLKNIGINSGSDLLVVKTRQLSERADRLEETARPAHLERSAGAIRLSNGGTHARALVSIRETEIRAPDGRPLFRLGPLFIEPGDRIALLGPNGAGKSQLVRRLRAAGPGGDPGRDPGVQTAASLRLGFSDQTLSQLDAFPTPWESVKQIDGLADQNARTLLAGAGIAIDAQTAPLSRLSGGQRARLALLILRLSRPNFYLLDEPTNHLDIEGQELLRDELIRHQTACLLASHDRAFVREAATRIWVIDGKRLIETEDPDPVFDRLMGG